MLDLIGTCDMCWELTPLSSGTTLCRILSYVEIGHVGSGTAIVQTLGVGFQLYENLPPKVCYNCSVPEMYVAFAVGTRAIARGRVSLSFQKATAGE